MSNKEFAPVDARVQKTIKAFKTKRDVEAFSIPKIPYANSFGSFGILLKKEDKISGVSWEGCRDRFQTTSEPKGFYEFLFCHQKGTGDNVIDFIRTVEEIIKLKEEDRLDIRKTTVENVIYIKLSEWWKYRVRRSLLTALLRCGQAYEERNSANFEQALFSQYYTSNTKAAIVEFLKGRTASRLKKSTGFSGWYQLFNAKKENDVRKYLVKLKKKQKENTELPPIVDKPMGD